MSERTLAIIKPDVVEAGNVGAVVSMIEAAGLRIVQMKVVLFYEYIGRTFYQEHEGKEFFAGLLEFMRSGRSISMVLEGENAVQRLRELNGATNPAKAADGTIRKRFGTPDGGPRNAMHGSDSAASAEREIEIFFPELIYAD